MVQTPFWMSSPDWNGNCWAHTRLHRQQRKIPILTLCFSQKRLTKKIIRFRLANLIAHNLISRFILFFLHKLVIHLIIIFIIFQFVVCSLEKILIPFPILTLSLNFFSTIRLNARLLKYYRVGDRRKTVFPFRQIATIAELLSPYSPYTQQSTSIFHFSDFFSASMM